MKRCYICKEIKELQDFYKDATRPDGKGTKCKSCASSYSKQLETIPVPETKFCNSCELIKSSSQFHKKKNSSDGLQGSCKACRNELRRAVYKLNVEHERKLRKTLRDVDPIRARKWRSEAHAARRRRKYQANGSHSESDWLKRIKELCSCCYYCKNSNSVLTKDHLIPLSRGGSDYIDNIVPACKSCNCSKGTKTEKEFNQRTNAGVS
jgi:5-methylcytosine-specific restriction endonuclease McrA